MVLLYSLEFLNLEWTPTHLSHTMELLRKLLLQISVWETLNTHRSITTTQCLLASSMEVLRVYLMPMLVMMILLARRINKHTF
jgi:hypothetical protein